jgi:hypothetical protein
VWSGWEAVKNALRGVAWMITDKLEIVKHWVPKGFINCDKLVRVMIFYCLVHHLCHF